MPEQPLCQPLCLLQQRELFWVRLPSRQTPVWVWALPDRLHCPGGDSAGRSHWCRNIQIQKEEKVNKILSLNHFLFNMLLFFRTFEMFIFYHIFFSVPLIKRQSKCILKYSKWKCCIYFDNLHWNISFDIRLWPNLYIILSGLVVACMDLSLPTLDRLPATVMMTTKRVYWVCILRIFYFSWFKCCFLANLHQTFLSSTTFIFCNWAIEVWL